MAYWKEIGLSPFEQAPDRTTDNMSHFITKCMSNTLSTMIILQQWVHSSTKLCLCCGPVPETIHSKYQCTHEVSRGRCTASVDTFRKWLGKLNKDSNITTLFIDSLLYIAGEWNYPPQCTNLSLHYDIRCIGWPYILIGLIPRSFAPAQQNYFTHIGSKIIGLKYASQNIIKIWKLIHGKWIHRSKIKHAG